MDYRSRLRCVAPLFLLLIFVPGCTTSVTKTVGGNEFRVVPCLFYSPSAPAGQMAEVTITGPNCDQIMQWVANKTGHEWASTKLIEGILIAQLGRGQDVIRVFQNGMSSATDQLAGYLADDLQKAGWNPQVPT